MSLVGTTIGNITIDALIGRGGMGEVYRGHDTRLDRLVAIKTLHRRRRVGEENKARFLREARLLSKLDDPRICRVYDLIETGDADHLVLEYIEGETLSRAPIWHADAMDKLRVLEQIAVALDAAHRAGIVHRDLKPANVMVLPDGRVKVLDFGIARMASGDAEVDEGRGPPPLRVEDDGAADSTPGLEPSGDTLSADELASMTTFTRHGALIGTVHYMSPEQARGEPATSAADVYALGILAHELLTGTHGYGADNPKGEELLSRVTAARRVVPEGLDPAVVTWIDGCTAPLADDRPTAQSAAAGLRTLLERPRLVRRRARIAVASGVALVLLTAVIALTAHLSRPAPLVSPDQIGRVALLPFVNATGEPELDWVELGLSELVARSLHETEGIEVVSTEQVDRQLQRRTMDLEAGLGAVEAGRLALDLHAELVIATTITRSDEVYEFDYRTWNVNGSRSHRTLEDGDLTHGAGELGRRLALRVRPAAVWIEFADRYSEDPFANQLYAMGRATDRSLGPQAARPYFEICIERDEDFLMAAVDLATVERNLAEMEGAEARVRDVIERARAAGDEVSLRYATLELSRVLRARGAYEEATPIIEEAITLAESAGDREAQVWALLALGYNLQLRHRTTESLEVLARCVDLADDMGEAYHAANCRYALARGEHGRGQLDEAARLTAAALETYVALGDVAGQATANHQLGRIRRSQTRYDEALQHYERARALHGETGAVLKQGTSTAALANTMMDMGDLDGAESTMVEALDLLRRAGVPLYHALGLYYLADLHVRQGRLDAAERRLAEGLALYPDLTFATITTAHLAYARGEWDRAVSLLEQVKAEVGVGWEPSDEIELEIYRRAARDGRRHALPYEADYVPIAQTP